MRGLRGLRGPDLSGVCGGAGARLQRLWRRTREDTCVSDEKKYSERDMALAKREAWVSGRGMGITDAYANARRDEWKEEAARRYPCPRVTRPRVVRDPQMTHYGPASGHVGDLYWSVRDGRLIPVDHGGKYVEVWEHDTDTYPTTNRVRLWADLLANPLETVEDDS